MLYNCQKCSKALILLACLGIFSLTSSSSFAASKARSTYNPRYASIVMDARSGDVLHAAHADELRYPASLTKMMTLYLVFEALESGKLKINQRLRVSRHASSQIPSKLHLKPGSTISVREAILALVTKSANDVAAVVAEALGGTESQFAVQMTRKARRLGMQKTVFGNASGVPRNQKRTTAREMAILARALYYHFPHYYRYFSTRGFQYRGQYYNNHNRLLGRIPGVDGVKTGFTNAAGRNLVASCVRNGQRIFAVVMGGRTNQTRDQHMINLINRAYVQLPRHKAVTPVPYQKPIPSQNIPLPPTAPIPLKTQPVLPTTKPATYWAVQVGAFAQSNTAHHAAQRLKTAVHSLKTTNISVNAAGREKKLFLARLVGLSKTQALEACRELKRKGLDCLALRPR